VTADAVNRIWDQANQRRAYEVGSPAEIDSRNPRIGTQVREALSFGNLLIVAALDHADQLAKWGLNAAGCVATPVWAPWSVSRSLIECCGTAAWLAQPGISARKRASRALALWFENAESRSAHGLDQNAVLAELELEMRGLGIQKRPGVATRAERVRFALTPFFDDMKAYSLLSAVSHGETWAIVELGYVEDGDHSDPGWARARKEPPALWLWTALVLAETSLDRAAMLQAKYRGWIA
jgi:hypothetical protein